MSRAIDLSCRNVSKRYSILEDTGSARSGFLSKVLRQHLARRQFWALRDINFDVERGQALGIIGHNGAGKSTLLKLLSSITAPTTGEIVVSGRIAALLEVGSGFHPELTGRENIFLSGSILGMTRREIHSKLERIIDFAEVRQFIDVPVKRYSSGMYVRLGFSIAAHLEPDVLLLDEVLAVGDAAFQKKCTDRILELKRAGTTIVFISHDLAAVENMCDRVIVMNQGRMTFDGAPSGAIAHYYSAAATPERFSRVAYQDRAVEVTAVTCLNQLDERIFNSETGQTVKIRIDYICHRPVRGAFIDVFFNSHQGLVSLWGNRFSGEELSFPPGAGSVEFTAEELSLLPDSYTVDVVIEQMGQSDPIEWVVRVANLHVNGGPNMRGARFYQPHRWRLLHDSEVKPRVEQVL